MITKDFFSPQINIFSKSLQIFLHSNLDSVFKIKLLSISETTFNCKQFSIANMLIFSNQLLCDVRNCIFLKFQFIKFFASFQYLLEYTVHFLLLVTYIHASYPEVFAISTNHLFLIFNKMLFFFSCKTIMRNYCAA